MASLAAGRALGLLALGLLCLPKLVAVHQASGAETAGISREAAQSAARKFRQIDQGSRPGHTFGLVRLSESEANSYLHYELASDFPPGVSKARLKFQPGQPTGFLEVDFDKIKEGFKNPPNFLMDYILRGVHLVAVEGTLAASGGIGRFHLETVTVDGIAMPRIVVDYLIEHYLKPRYPGVAIDRPFSMPYSIDKLNVETGGVLMVGRPNAARL